MENFSEESPFNGGGEIMIVPAPMQFENDSVAKQRKMIREGFDMALQNEKVRAALSWMQQRGKTTGHQDTDAILCWLDIIKVVPDDLRRVLMQGDFMVWERAKMMKAVLKRYYLFEYGKMTGELLGIEDKTDSADHAVQ